LVALGLERLLLTLLVELDQVERSDVPWSRHSLTRCVSTLTGFQWICGQTRIFVGCVMGGHERPLRRLACNKKLAL